MPLTNFISWSRSCCIVSIADTGVPVMATNTELRVLHSHASSCFRFAMDRGSFSSRWSNNLCISSHTMMQCE